MNIQPIEIEKHCIDKYVKVHDEFGWTGEFKLSAKNILDIVIDLTKSERQTPTEANKNADTKQLIIADVSKQRELLIDFLFDFVGGDKQAPIDEWADSFLERNKGNL